ncbi:MAG TPA: hypothetical protein VFM45_11215 [Anaeromyxobacteraceae bacterium]|nr:hypothetical protein [Anaeromyxobacteraceae bacterium]
MATACSLQDGIVHLEYEETVSPEELLRAAQEAFAVALGTGKCLFFADLTHVRGGHSPIDLLRIVDLFESHSVPRSMREAVLLPAEGAATPNARFFEDACQNRGWNVRIFSDRATALSWLQGG